VDNEIADEGSAVNSLASIRVLQPGPATMDQHTARRIAAASAALRAHQCGGIDQHILANRRPDAPAPGRGTDGAPKAEKAPPASAKNEQAIAVLVNDEPITAYEIQQRTAFLALNAGWRARPQGQSRGALGADDQGPKLNERLQVLLREKNVKTREEALAVQKEYVTKLQHNMIEQIKREARDALLPKLRKEAQEELIEER
jgi:peptidyl-prolyl cis-trans isomerase SurA